jgi:hypothetical protein
MKRIFLPKSATMEILMPIIVLAFFSTSLKAQTTNSYPAPTGESVLGNHLHVGQSNEVWTDAYALYFNYRGAGATTYFWNLGGASGKSVMTLVNTGNIGIGTNAPASKLHLNSAIERETFRIYKNTTTSNYLSIWQGDAGAAIDPIGTGKLWLGYDQATDVYMGNGSGNVGIGTTSPIAKLQVNTTSATTSYGSINSSDLGLFLRNTNATDNNLNIISFGDAAGYGVAHVGAIYKNQTTHEGKLFFATKGPTGFKQQMLIDEVGNVGIGTTTPGNFKLAVNGKIWGTEVQVALTNPGPDYVFEKSYALPTLEEVKSYIDQNKHLPEVPSAKEMEANGVNVGEMNMLLLKKIEELTLYLIEQQKEINELKNQIKK